MLWPTIGNILVFVFSIVMLSYGADGQCPEDYHSSVKECMTKSGLDPMGGSMHTSIIAPNKVLCKSGKMQKTVDCLDKIIKSCSSDVGATRELSLTVDVDGWRKATKLLCDNVDMFKENKDCLAKTNNEDTSNCINAKMSAFEGEKQSKILTSGPLNTNNLMAIACTYVNQILGCLKRPMKEHCPSKVSKKVSEVIRLMLPPACRPPPELPQKVDKNDEGYKSNPVKDDENSAEKSKPVVFICVLSLVSLLLW